MKSTLARFPRLTMSLQLAFHFFSSKLLTFLPCAFWSRGLSAVMMTAAIGSSLKSTISYGERVQPASTVPHIQTMTDVQIELGSSSNYRPLKSDEGNPSLCSESLKFYACVPTAYHINSDMISYCKCVYITPA